MYVANVSISHLGLNFGCVSPLCYIKTYSSVHKYFIIRQSKIFGKIDDLGCTPSASEVIMVERY